MAVDITPSALLEFAKTIKSGDQKSASSSVATVTRIDPDGVTYVSLPGGVDETPIATAGTVYNVGDTVYVTRSGGKLRANENLSSPSVGARVIKEASESLSKAVRIAKQAADEAGKVANAVNQHFWYDDNGAHVTDVTKDEWAAAVADNFSDLSADKQYPNLLENSLGILLRSALNYLVSITRSAIAFYDGLGNTASNIVAQFGTDGAQIGYVGDTHTVIDYHSLQLVDKEGDAYFHISDLRDSSGGAEIVATFIGGYDRNQFEVSLEINEVVSVTIDGVETSDYEVGGDGFIFVLDDSPEDGSVVVFTYITYSQSAKAYTFGYRETGSRIGGLSTASGYELEASGFCSHAEGFRTVASGNHSHAEGYESEVTEYARAAHAEGYHTTARGDYSHAEGLFCQTIGLSAHAEGYYTTARGRESHSEGSNTTANGDYSHSQNFHTIASSDYQTTLGKYNVEDANGTYALIVGNGTADNARSNALTLDWSGTLGLAAPLPVSSGGTGLTASPSMLTNLESTTAADVMVSSPQPGVTGTLPIDHGGTGMTGVTNATTGIFTAGSGITISSQEISIFGKVAQLELLIKHSSAWSVGTQYNVGTIASAYRPSQNSGGTMGSSGSALVLSDGKVYCRPFVNSALAANSQNYLRFTYILA